MADPSAVFADEIFRSGAAEKLAQIIETNSASLPDSLLRSSLSLLRVLEQGTLGTMEDGQYIQTTNPQVAYNIRVGSVAWKYGVEPCACVCLTLLPTGLHPSQTRLKRGRATETAVTPRVPGGSAASPANSRTGRTDLPGKDRVSDDDVRPFPAARTSPAQMEIPDAGSLAPISVSSFKNRVMAVQTTNAMCM